MMFEFGCPKCTESVKAADDQAGEPIICPKCSATIKVPGEKPSSGSSQPATEEWSVFDEDERFIEETVTQSVESNYRTREDDREPIVDNDAEVVRRQEEEERQAVEEILNRAQAGELSEGPSAASGMTVEEKIAAEKNLESHTSKGASGQTPAQQGWNISPSPEPDRIRLEGQPADQNSVRAKCHVCESVTLVGIHKAGSNVICSDCGSAIPVPAASGGQTENPVSETQDQQQELEKKQKARVADELFVMPDESDDEGYGLAPAAEDLLRPVAATFEDPDALAPAMDSTDTGQQPKPLDSREDRSDLETSELFEEMQAEKITRFELLPWKRHIFGILTDTGFILRVVLSSLVMLIGYSIFYGGDALGALDPGSRGLVMLGSFIKIFAIPSIPIGFLTVCWLGQKVLNSTILGDKTLPDLEGSTVMEWVSNCLFVAVGLFIGACPGAMLGALISLQITEWHGFWAIFAVGTMTAMAIAPLIILSAMYNRSPFKISASKISESIKRKSDDWIEFYLPALILSLINGCFWFIAMTQLWILFAPMLFAMNVCFGIYFRMLGRLMGAILEDNAKRS